MRAVYQYSISAELDTGRVDARVGLGRVGSQNLYNLTGRVASGQVTKFAKIIVQFLSSVIYTVVLAVFLLSKNVKIFSETTQSSAVVETSHLLYSYGGRHPFNSRPSR